VFAPDAVVYGVLGWGGIEQVMPIWHELHDGLRLELTVEEIIAEGDIVAVRYTERGTFVGSFRGHAPTGRSYELVAMEWFQMLDGRILRRWGARDAAAQSRQIGLGPPA
jgi:predicted ester cyclase